MVRSAASRSPSASSATPDLIFLDEPTTGFDPSARRQAWDVIRNLTKLGKTILLTTHYMDEAQNLADRVAVIDHGLIVAEGTPDTLGGRATARTEVRFALAEHSPDSLPVAPAAIDGATVEYHTDDPTALLHALTGWAVERGTVLQGLTVTSAPRSRTSTSSSPMGNRHEANLPRLVALVPGSLRMADLLAHADFGLLHDLLSAADLCGVLRGIRQRGHRLSRNHHRGVLCAVARRLLRRVGDLHEHLDHHGLPARRGDPEAGPRHAAAGVDLPRWEDPGVHS